jgi:glycosyltransferase involved in cell wall biosynthesis
VPLGSTRDVTGERFGKGAFHAPLPDRLKRVVSTGGYVVVVGNFYPHKQVSLAVRALEQLAVPIVAFGPLDGVSETEFVSIVVSGTLSDAGLRDVIEGAALVVFPSAYEGFGLPIADALDFGVPVVAFDTSVAREVAGALGGEGAVRFFSRFDELAGVVSSALQDEGFLRSAAPHRENIRDLEPYNQRLLEMALELIDAPIDIERLDSRFAEIKLLERLGDADRTEIRAARKIVSEVLHSESFRIGHWLVRHVPRFVRERRGGRRR